MMILAPFLLYSSLISHLIHKVASVVIIVNPPTLPIQPGCPPTNANDNVLQAAINTASAGDTIQLAPGAYYFECNVYVNKPLTILGACAGLAPNPSGGTRDGCATESIVYADATVAPNGLYGISIESSNVIIDGLVFQEVSPSTFRSMISVLADSSLFQCNGSYSNIILRNNYMKGFKESSVLPWGGQTVGNACNISDLLVKNNILIVTNPMYSLWDPIGFRGATPFNDPPSGTITLNNFQMLGNNITCAPSGGGNCNVLNIGNSYLTGTTLISNNIAFGNNQTDEFCPFRTFKEIIPVYSDNQGINFTECIGRILEVFPPTASPTVRPTATPTRSPTKSIKRTKAPKNTKAPKPKPTVRPTAAPTRSPTKSIKRSKAPKQTPTPKKTPAPKATKAPKTEDAANTANAANAANAPKTANASKNK